MTREEAISRHDVLDAISRIGLFKSDTREVQAVAECLRAVEALPSVKPQEPKTGHWIEERTYMKCPNCNDIWHYEENQTERFKFCPTCGMRIKQ